MGQRPQKIPNRNAVAAISVRPSIARDIRHHRVAVESNLNRHPRWLAARNPGLEDEISLGFSANA